MTLKGSMFSFSLFFFLLSLTACGSGDSDSGDTPIEPAGEAIMVDKPELFMEVGEQTPLEVSLIFADGGSQELHADELLWRCDDEYVAVNGQNQLTALAAGDTDCTVYKDRLKVGIDIHISEGEVLAERLSISPAGPITLALSSQQDVSVQAHYSDGSSRTVDAPLWRCDSVAAQVTDQILAAEQEGQVNCSVEWQGLSSSLDVTVIPEYPEPRHLSLSFLDHVRRGEYDASAFYAWVNRAEAGNPGWGFRATDAVYMYYLTGDAKYIHLAIEMVDEFVFTEEAAIAECVANNVEAEENRIRYCPNLLASFNSYLRVSSAIVPLAYTYDWGYDFLSDSQKQRWENYANQTIFNIWNRQQASWGGVPYIWSGWGVDVAGSNYFFSFISATMSWAIASDNQEWLSMLANEKMPLFEAYFEGFEGGGSREGTNYGVAQRQLFVIYDMWRMAGGEDMVAKLDHVKETIDYWIHATLPTLDLYAPYGDQSRVAYPRLYEYYESIVQLAASMNLGTEHAKRARWWLDNNSVSVSKGNLYTSLYQQESEAVAPTALLYHAKSAGQLFVRSSWETNATWFAVVAGIRDEAHSHHEHGSFTLFKDDWLAVTENIWTHTGIHSGTEYHNIIRFVHEGTNINQARPMETGISYQQQDETTLINLSLGSAYQHEPERIQSWERELSFNLTGLRVKDECQVADDVTSIWQVNVPAEPEIQDDGTIKAGNLLIIPIKPASPSINLVDWKALNPNDYRNNKIGGYKVELQGDACDYEVELRILAQ